MTQTAQQNASLGISQSLTDLLARVKSIDSVTREAAVVECRDFAPQLTELLAAIIQCLNDANESTRDYASQLFLDAFPNADDRLSQVLASAQSAESKVRLAAIGEFLILLPDLLGAMLGMKPRAAHDSVAEDAVELAGRWVAWTPHRRRLLAVADSYGELMAQVDALGEEDPEIEQVPLRSPRVPPESLPLLEDESPNILDDIRKEVPDADLWLDEPNIYFALRKPRDLLGTEREWEIRNLLRQIRIGITS